MAGRLLSQLQFEIRTFLDNRIIRITTYASVILCVLTLCLPLLFWKTLPPDVPLWFSRPWGLERLASTFWLFLPPLSCLLWLVVSTTVSIRLLKEHLVFSQILSVVTLLICIMSCITVATVITLVI